MDILTELKQVLVKEQTVGDLTLASIRENFFPDVYNYLKEVDDDTGKILLAKIKRSRMTKLARHACAFTPIDNVGGVLSPEEVEMYNGLLDTMKEYWKDE